MKFKSLCVFTGSNPGNHPDYEKNAFLLGETLAKHQITLVYGGASVGLMGRVADACLQAGGKVHGVIPRSLEEKELSHKNLTHLDVVESMHERKARMAELSDGFIAMPGGMGTLEEIFEVITWSQLGFHDKPCGFLNVNGYYDHLLQFLDQTVTQGFQNAIHHTATLSAATIDELLIRFENYTPVRVQKWVEKSTDSSIL